MNGLDEVQKESSSTSQRHQDGALADPLACCCVCASELRAVMCGVYDCVTLYELIVLVFLDAARPGLTL